MAKKKRPKNDTPSAAASSKEGATREGAGAQRRVEALRKKLTQAMEDPLMRDQIVKAIRAMMAEGR